MPLCLQSWGCPIKFVDIPSTKGIARAYKFQKNAQARQIASGDPKRNQRNLCGARESPKTDPFFGTRTFFLLSDVPNDTADGLIRLRWVEFVKCESNESSWWKTENSKETSFWTSKLATIHNLSPDRQGILLSHFNTTSIDSNNVCSN